jgi:hypothetical protein
MMISLLPLVLILSLVWFTVARPSLAARQRLLAERTHRAYRQVQLRAIRRYYPAVAGLSDQEIQDNFNVNEAYHRIGLR